MEDLNFKKILDCTIIFILKKKANRYILLLNFKILHNDDKCN